MKITIKDYSIDKKVVGGSLEGIAVKFYLNDEGILDKIGGIRKSISMIESEVMDLLWKKHRINNVSVLNNLGNAAVHRVFDNDIRVSYTEGNYNNVVIEENVIGEELEDCKKAFMDMERLIGDYLIRQEKQREGNKKEDEK